MSVESKMNKELLNVPVLAMYDVRGIQDYIFRTNRVKEIIGASHLVEDIIEDTLKEAVQDILQDEVILEWEPDKDGIAEDEKKLRFIVSENIKIQVLFIGGGNAYVLYRTGALCEKVNRKMSKMILKNTYSLQLAVAVVEAHIEEDDYESDYKCLVAEMETVKEKMSVARTFGALPIAKIDEITGFPLVKTDRIVKNAMEEMSRETYLKLKKEEQIRWEENRNEKRIEREFDELVTQHGEESVLAIVHIDGNDMGKKIGKLLKEHNSNYTQAVGTMREISYRINHTFKDKVFEKIKVQFEKWIEENGYDENVSGISQKEKSKYFKKDGTYLRKIIVAGDDITFVCNAKVALALVQYFAKYVSQYVLYGNKDIEEDMKNYGISICAGIAYINSHFPFHIGYKVAEACCDNAKKEAKKREYLVDENVGNWVDFQICRNAQTGNLEGTRQKNYVLKNGNLYLLRRPFHITTANDSCKQINFEKKEFTTFISQIEQFKKYSKSKALQLRNTYPKGKESMESLISFLKARADSTDGEIPDVLNINPFDEETAVYYDALEMYEFYEEIQLEEDN